MSSKVSQQLDEAIEFQVTPQFQWIKLLKISFLNLVVEMKKGQRGRESSVVIGLPGYKPIDARITLCAGHWTLFGSVVIRLENFPMTYDGGTLEADFSIMLLEPVAGTSAITTDMIQFNGASVSLSNPETFEQWLKGQVANAWNDP